MSKLRSILQSMGSITIRRRLKSTIEGNAQVCRCLHPWPFMGYKQTYCLTCEKDIKQ